MKRLSLGLFVVALLLALPLTALMQDDGRINDAAHLGGIGIFCVTDEGATTNDRDNAASLDLWGPGGSELLASILFSDIPLLGTGNIPTYAASNGASMGLASLENGSILAFGTDEHGKEFTFIWPGDCGPIGPPVGEDEAEEEIDCPPVINGLNGYSNETETQAFNKFFEIVPVIFDWMPTNESSWQSIRVGEVITKVPPIDIPEGCLPVFVELKPA